MDNDTIAAISTPIGKGGIAVIRISGPETLDILTAVVEKCPANPVPRHLYHGYVQDKGKRIDECMAVFFKGPNSYTGEDVAEITTHANPYLLEEVLTLVLSHKNGVGIRSALPGEFTYRAFKSGKMDLIQAESVNELIAANSRYYAHMKFGTLEGRLSQFMTALKEDLIRLGVLIETKIEFEEDQLLEPIDFAAALQEPLQRIETLLENARFNDLLDKGLHVVIAGKVNVGKSSLFNALLMEERSITSPVPGTTRDFIKEKLYVDGIPIDITDVAGINSDTTCDIEAQGMQRSLDKLENCDAVIFMLDNSRPMEAADKEIYRLVKQKRRIIVANKLDIVDPCVSDAIALCFNNERIAKISVKEHRNLDVVTNFLKTLVKTVKERESEYTVNQRQKSALEELQEVLTQISKKNPNITTEIELTAEEIRRAVAIIGSLMGEITPDDILNKIFSEFCVGK